MRIGLLAKDRMGLGTTDVDDTSSLCAEFFLWRHCKSVVPKSVFIPATDTRSTVAAGVMRLVFTYNFTGGMSSL
jgi:hypothetical protein